MLTCRQVTERSTGLLEGDLSFRARLAMRLHIALCVHCWRFNRQFRALVRSLHLRHQAEPVTDDFVNCVVNAVGTAPSDVSGPEQAGT